MRYKKLFIERCDTIENRILKNYKFIFQSREDSSVNSNRVNILEKNNFLDDIDSTQRTSIWQLLLVPFIIGLMTLSHIKGWSRLMIFYGFIYAWFFSLYYFLYCKQKLPTEVFIYIIWIVWVLCGWFIATDKYLYLQSLLTIIQIGTLIFLISANTSLYKNLSIIMIAIAIGGIIVGISSYLSGEFQIASDIEARSQASGITKNANSFAYHLLFVIFAIFYFWEKKSSILWRILLLAFVVGIMIAVIFSGSRKGFLGVLAFLALWYLFCQSKKFLKNTSTTFVVLLLLIVGTYYTTNYVMSQTYLGKRFEHLEKYGDSIRIMLYKEGFEMIRNNPIMGVGLDNFRVFSASGLYSHSDYIEVAADTGIVGFFLYFLIYLLLWRRFSIIQSEVDNPRLLYIMGFLKASIITILLVAFGRVNIASKLTWIFIAAAIGFTWSVKSELETEDFEKDNNFN